MDRLGRGDGAGRARPELRHGPRPDLARGPPRLRFFHRVDLHSEQTHHGTVHHETVTAKPFDLFGGPYSVFLFERRERGQNCDKNRGRTSRFSLLAFSQVVEITPMADLAAVLRYAHFTAVSQAPQPTPF